MKFFVTGASGYIGGSVARILIGGGHQVRGLTRDAVRAEALERVGIEPVIGSLDDADTLARESRIADVVINAADADHRASLVAIIAALRGTGKALIHTTGSSVVGDDARGEFASASVFDEQTPVDVRPRKQARHEINVMVLAAAAEGIRAVVICPSLIYGTGRGANRQSIQVPFLIEQAQAAGVVRVVGHGLNRWSTVHIDDLVDLYRLAIDSAPPGAFYYAENGESSFAEIGEAIADRLALPGVQAWDPDEAAALWGEGRAYYTYGSNSRVRATRARSELNWQPTHSSVLRWIREEI